MKRAAAGVAAGIALGWLAHRWLSGVSVPAPDTEMHYSAADDGALCERDGVTTTVFSAIVTCQDCKDRLDVLLHEADHRHDNAV